MLGLLKFNMEGKRVKRDQRSTYRKSNPCQFFNLNHDSGQRLVLEGSRSSALLRNHRAHHPVAAIVSQIAGFRCKLTQTEDNRLRSFPAPVTLGHFRVRRPRHPVQLAARWTRGSLGPTRSKNRFRSCGAAERLSTLAHREASPSLGRNPPHDRQSRPGRPDRNRPANQASPARPLLRTDRPPGRNQRSNRTQAPPGRTRPHLLLQVTPCPSRLYMECGGSAPLFRRSPVPINELTTRIARFTYLRKGSGLGLGRQRRLCGAGQWCRRHCACRSA